MIFRFAQKVREHVSLSRQMRRSDSENNNSQIIIGLRPILEAIESGKTIDRVLIQHGLQGELFRDVREKLRQQNIGWQMVPIEKLNSISRANHQGVIAFISPIAFANLEAIVSASFKSGKIPLLLMLDGVTDVRNFGAICRSAECFGVDAVIIPEQGSVRISEDAVKTSAGALMHIPICKAGNLVETCSVLSASGILIFIANEKAHLSIFDADFTHPTCIILGSEDTGVRKELLLVADQIVKIPLRGKTESLNVSTSNSIFLYELDRQRRLL